MKQGWEIKKLGEVCDILDSQRKPVTKKDRKEGIYPYYGATGIQDYVDAYIFDGRYLLVGEDGAKWGAMDKTAFVVEGKCWVNNHAHILKVHDNLIDTFIEYYLVFKDLDEYITGAIVRKLTQQALREIPIPVPPIAEQEKIVAELDCLSGIIEKKKQQLKELDALAQSIFYEMFGDPVENDKGWKITFIENICSSIVRGPFGSALKKEFFVEPTPSAYKVYEQKHAIQKSADIGTYYIDKERFETLKRFEVKVGDIIMSCSGTIGEFFEIPVGAEKGIINQALLKYTLKDNIEKVFFLYVMEWVKDNFDKKGTGLQNIGSVSTIKKTKISFPPLTLQQDFASKIEAIEKQKELIKQSIQETETLFNSRMDYYFN